MMRRSYFNVIKEHLPINLDHNLISAFEACSYPIASHDHKAEPLFNYANKAALLLFKMKAQDMIGLPSKKSASQSNQASREAFLKKVSRYGFVKHYQGERIASDGTVFYIEDATVWNLMNEINEYCGQAVIIFKVSY